MVHVLLKQSDASGETFPKSAALYTHLERNQLNIGINLQCLSHSEQKVHRFYLHGTEGGLVFDKCTN